LDAYACREYLEGFEIIGLQEDRLPNLSAIIDRLEHNARKWSSSGGGFF
jgi:phenylalanine-4-hydroxylase